MDAFSSLFLSCSDLSNWPSELNTPAAVRSSSEGSQLPTSFCEDSLWLNQVQFCLLDILGVGGTRCDTLYSGLPEAGARTCILLFLCLPLLLYCLSGGGLSQSLGQNTPPSCSSKQTLVPPWGLHNTCLQVRAFPIVRFTLVPRIVQSRIPGWCGGLWNLTLMTTCVSEYAFSLCK